jgi:small-conductance mechanosensitive channel
MNLRRFENLWGILLVLLLIGCIAAFFLTRDRSAAPAATAKAQAPLVDDRLLQTAHQLAATADTSAEQDLAREALRVADHELDQAFATALREKVAPTTPASGPLKQVIDRINQLTARIASDQDRIAKLTKSAAGENAAADQLALAQAQLALDQDELADAQQDLAREGGDPHAKLERALQEHEAAQHQGELPKVVAATAPATLREKVRLWLGLGDRERQLAGARQQTAEKAAKLGRAHDTLKKLLANQSSNDAETAALVARLRNLSDQSKTLVELGKRIEDTQQLRDLYQRWIGVVEERRRGALHQVLGSLAWVLAILFAVTGIDKALQHAFGGQLDRRRLQQLRLTAGIAVQAVGVVLILLIVFGPPTQTSTMIGLATAGLTVALKDFIVSFFGWFVLMGRNGVRVGDWVEIQGVSGEVISTGVWRTVLLEMGGHAGHPTGRRVAFMNSFAIEGHYFNFSTAGQWLWDELQISLPATGDPYQMAQQIRQIVEHETEADAKAAEQDWAQVAREYGVHAFSATPAVALRPAATGMDAVVRYITRAPERHKARSRLFEAIITLLHERVALSSATVPE